MATALLHSPCPSPCLPAAMETQKYQQREQLAAVGLPSATFTAPDADLLLRSSDGVAFRVYRRILAVASPFFQDLLSLPQPEYDATDGDFDSAENARMPTIDVPEPAAVLDTLLQLVYPGPLPAPHIATLDELAPLLSAALKYDCTRAAAVLRTRLVSPEFLNSSPTRVFAIASRHGLDEEARVASTATLRVNVLDAPLADELRHISAYEYHRLLSLHRTRGASAAAALLVEEDVRCVQCSASHYGALCPPRWWIDFERRARDELLARPTTDVVFSIEFLGKSSHTGCQRCPASILESHAFLERLKQRIDALPSTI